MIEKTEKEFNIYRMREMAQLESDFDKMMKELPSKERNRLHFYACTISLTRAGVLTIKSIRDL